VAGPVEPGPPAEDDVRTLRLFFGLACPALPAIRSLRAGLQASASARDGTLRVVPLGNLHLTLRYLGTVSADRVPDLCGRVAPLLTRWQAFDYRLEGVGRFSRALWIRAQVPATLYDLVRCLDQELAEAGFAPDRKAFLPHVTVARLSRGHGFPVTDWLSEHADRSFGQVSAAAVTLYRSQTGDGGSRYTSVATFPLAAPPVFS